MQSFIDFLLNRRYFLAIGCVVLGIALTWGMTNSSLDGTFGSILSEDDPYKAEVMRREKTSQEAAACCLHFKPTLMYSI